ncbi:MAG: NUDIX hydrolase [Phycicoccus sp.]|nr:NUDIX hydrolase [Phycicoccus sp.]
MVSTIPAAGSIPWRVRDGALEVALVHRPRYDDWSWAKGKLDPGEEWPVAAARETHEETGLKVRLGQPLPPASYAVLGPEGPSDKIVAYWSARVIGGSGVLENEIDEVAWLSVAEADARLDYARDREQLRALVRTHQDGRLETWPIILVRHAEALPRGKFTGSDDRRRPLTATGHRRAKGLEPILAAYGVQRLVTSPSVRCVDTLVPYAARTGLTLRERPGLSEEGYALDPAKAGRHLARLLARGTPAAMCTHGPLLPGLIATIAERVEPDTEATASLSQIMAEASRDKLVKGEALVIHLSGYGDQAVVAAAERYLP